MSKRFTFYILVLVCVALTGCTASPRKLGRADAKRDLAKGTLAQETYGLPTIYQGEYFKLLAEKYPIEMRPVAGCLVDDKIVGHAAGYNEIMDREIEHRFGTNILDKAFADAKKHYKEQLEKDHPPK